MFQTILVPLDGSEQAEQVLPLASRIALIQVIPFPSPSYGEYDQYRISSFSYTEEVDEA